MKHENVLERVYEPGRLIKAWRRVKQNAGAAGIDKMSVQDFEQRKKLEAGTYRFKPARRVHFTKATLNSHRSGRRSKSGLPGRYEPFGAADKAAIQQVEVLPCQLPSSDM